MGFIEEVNEFIKLALNRFESVAKKDGLDHFVIGTWMEPYWSNTLWDIYIQMKYICEYHRKDYIINQDFDEKKADLIYRHGTILQKITFDPWFEIKKKFENNPYFHWEDYSTELEIDEVLCNLSVGILVWEI